LGRECRLVCVTAAYTRTTQQYAVSNVGDKREKLSLTQCGVDALVSYTSTTVMSDERALGLVVVFFVKKMTGNV